MIHWSGPWKKPAADHAVKMRKICLTNLISLFMMDTNGDGQYLPVRIKEVVPMKYECPCGYVYDPEVGDPEGGIAPGTAFEDIPEDWVCPVCGLGKDAFTPA